MQNQITLGDILNEYGDSYISRNRISGQEKGLLHLLQACRTAALGSHFEKCDKCNYTGKSYNFPILGTSYAVTGTALRASKKTSWNGSINE
jgi:hypothetical protein